MAVTLTIEALREALRLNDTTEETAEVTRLLAYVTEAVEQEAPSGTDVAHNEAARRLAGYLHDQPEAGAGMAYANAMRASGAGRILLPFKIHRAGFAGAQAAAQAAVGSVGNPVTDVRISGGDLVVSFADGTSESMALPAGGGVGVAGSADLLVERLGTIDNPTLPDNRVWLATGIIIPASVHVLMIDAGQASDDYHLVDWDAILMHPPVGGGGVSMDGEFETFKGDAFTNLRIGHGIDLEVLLANDSTTALNLPHVHFERLLAPLAVGTGTVDTQARGAAAVAQGVAATAERAAEAAQADADSNALALALRIQRSDVSQGVGIAVTPVVGSNTGFTISATGGATGPMALTGSWRFVLLDPASGGEVEWDGSGLVGDISTWVFNCAGLAAAQAELLALEVGDSIEIEQAASRHQTITLTSTPTLSGTRVTVLGRFDRGGTSQIPTNFSNVTITLVPGPIQAVDGIARASAAAAQSDADANTATLGGLSVPSNSDIQGVVRGLVADWAESGDSGHVPGEKTTRKFYIHTSAINVNDEPDAASNVHDIHMYVTATEWHLYEHLGTLPPYLTLRSILSEGSLSAGSLIGLIATWAAFGNNGVIPPDKTGLNSVHDWAKAGGPDIPYVQMDTIIESWAVILDAAARAGGSVPEHIPLERLPSARFLPAPTGLDDGLVAVIKDSTWISAVPAGTSGVSAKVWRLEMVTAESVLDFPGEHAGEVYIRQRYLDTYNAAGVRTAVQDLGNGFLSDTGSRVISISSALDIKGLLAQTSIKALINIATTVPTATTATWGEMYGVSTVAGEVDDVWYRRREVATQQIWLPARLHSDNRDLHGYNNLETFSSTFGYDRGGALSPEAGFVQIIEEKYAGGQINTRAVIPVTSPLASQIAVLMFYRLRGDTASTELTLFRDVADSTAGHNYYVSANYTGNFKFIPGGEYTLTWRNSGDANDVVLHADERMVKISDQEDLKVVTADLQREIYETEDRVAAIESSGGAPSWHWFASVTGGAWSINADRTASYRSYPIGPYADYAAVRAAVMDGTMPQICIRISQNDPDGVDDDHGTTVLPNLPGFYFGAGIWRVFPGHALNVNPAAFKITFDPLNLLIQTDADIASSDTVVVRVAVWA